MILAIDTAGSTTSVAVLTATHPATAISSQHRAERMGQSEFLLPLIDAALEQAGITLAQIGYIAVCTGPGSFTGLRVGLATAHALARAQNVALYGINLFSALRHGMAQSLPAEQANNTAIVLDSYREELFVQMTAGSEPQMLDSTQLSEALDVQHSSYHAQLDQNELAVPPVQLDLPVGAVLVGQKLAALLAEGAKPADYPAAPFYLRAPDISTPKAACAQAG
jgi:tRNA threonylcarbamoyladenosine biosynthesis protein TsaB